MVLKLAIQGEITWTYSALAHDLGMSPSEVHAAARRATHAGLLDPDGRRVNRKALLEFLIHGLRYVFAPERGGLTRGFVTAYAAPPLASRIAQGNDPPPVWPDPDGPVRGETFRPLYRSATSATSSCTSALPWSMPSAAAARASASWPKSASVPPWAPHEACDPPSREWRRWPHHARPTLSRNRRAGKPSILRVTFPRNVATLVVTNCTRSGLLKKPLLSCALCARMTVNVSMMQSGTG